MSTEPQNAGALSNGAAPIDLGRAWFDEYVRRFNAKDATAFDDYLAKDALILNGTLELRGIQGMRDHYEQSIWRFFEETIHINRFVSDGRTLAVSMWTHFVATKSGTSIFGPVGEQDTFDFRGLVMYEIESAKFSKITVAYNSFARTNADGTVITLGPPH